MYHRTMQNKMPGETVGELRLRVERERAKKPKRWGGWKLKRGRELVWEDGRYYVDLDRMRSAAEMLDWIFQVKNKTWCTAECISDLLAALNELLAPQGTLCREDEDKSDVLSKPQRELLLRMLSSREGRGATFQALEAGQRVSGAELIQIMSALFGAYKDDPKFCYEDLRRRLRPDLQRTLTEAVLRDPPGEPRKIS